LPKPNSLSFRFDTTHKYGMQHTGRLATSCKSITVVMLCCCASVGSPPRSACAVVYTLDVTVREVFSYLFKGGAEVSTQTKRERRLCGDLRMSDCASLRCLDHWRGQHSTVVLYTVNCRLAKSRGLMRRVKYGTVIGHKMHFFVCAQHELPGYGFLFSQSQRRI